MTTITTETGRPSITKTGAKDSLWYRPEGSRAAGRGRRPHLPLLACDQGNVDVQIAV